MSVKLLAIKLKKTIDKQILMFLNELITYLLYLCSDICVYNKEYSSFYVKIRLSIIFF